MMQYWLMLVAAILLGLVGQVMLKGGAAAGAQGFVAQLLDWHTMLGLFLYGSSAMFYIVALRRIPMSVALPCTASTYVVLALIEYSYFGVSLGIARLTAIGLISAGVALLAAS